MTEYMDPQEFIDGGYLHEVNRLVLHPLGLALEWGRGSKAGTVAVWDYRDDPEGIYFDGSTLNAEKAIKVCAELLAKRKARMEALDYVVQPIPVAKVLTVNYLDPDKPTVTPDMEFEQ